MQVLFAEKAFLRSRADCAVITVVKCSLNRTRTCFQLHSCPAHVGYCVKRLFFFQEAMISDFVALLRTTAADERAREQGDGAVGGVVEQRLEEAIVPGRDLVRNNFTIQFKQLN